MSLADSPNDEQWAARIERGPVWTTTVTRLEIGNSARGEADARSMFTNLPVSAMPVEYLTPAIEDRAPQTHLILADKGQHRAPSIPDLLIAAAAELAGLTVQRWSWPGVACWWRPRRVLPDEGGAGSAWGRAAGPREGGGP